MKKNKLIFLFLIVLMSLLLTSCLTNKENPFESDLSSGSYLLAPEDGVAFEVEFKEYVDFKSDNSEILYIYEDKKLYIALNKEVSKGNKVIEMEEEFLDKIENIKTIKYSDLFSHNSVKNTGDTKSGIYVKDTFTTAYQQSGSFDIVLDSETIDITEGSSSITLELDIPTDFVIEEVSMSTSYTFDASTNTLEIYYNYYDFLNKDEFVFVKFRSSNTGDYTVGINNVKVNGLTSTLETNSGTIKVVSGPLGDYDRSGEVDLSDFVDFRNQWKAETQDPNYKLGPVDLNYKYLDVYFVRDDSQAADKLDLIDFAIFAHNYGKESITPGYYEKGEFEVYPSSYNTTNDGYEFEIFTDKTRIDDNYIYLKLKNEWQSDYFRFVVPKAYSRFEGFNNYSITLKYNNYNEFHYEYETINGIKSLYPSFESGDIFRLDNNGSRFYRHYARYWDGDPIPTIQVTKNIESKPNFLNEFYISTSPIGLNYNSHYDTWNNNYVDYEFQQVTINPDDTFDLSVPNLDYDETLSQDFVDYLNKKEKFLLQYRADFIDVGSSTFDNISYYFFPIQFADIEYMISDGNNKFTDPATHSFVYSVYHQSLFVDDVKRESYKKYLKQQEVYKENEWGDLIIDLDGDGIRDIDLYHLTRIMASNHSDYLGDNSKIISYNEISSSFEEYEFDSNDGYFGNYDLFYHENEFMVLESSSGKLIKLRGTNLVEIDQAKIDEILIY
jgi:hypothetical protein